MTVIPSISGLYLLLYAKKMPVCKNVSQEKRQIVNAKDEIITKLSWKSQKIELILMVSDEWFAEPTKD